MPLNNPIEHELLRIADLVDQGRYNAAADSTISLLQEGCGDLALAARCIELLLCVRRQDLVAKICKAELSHGCTDPEILALAGRMALVLGNFEEARTHLLAAIEKRPQDCGLLQMLVQTRRYQSLDDDDVRRFEWAWRNPLFQEAHRELAGFAFGKACDDAGDYERAAAVLKEVNSWAALAAGWKQESWNGFVEVITRLRIPRLPAASTPECIPVFIVGLPRSGTTLLADRLARSADVYNRGELNWLWLLWDRLARSQTWSSPAALDAAAQTYLRHLLRDDPPRRCYIDKNPLNIRLLPLVDALFPNARIIICRREIRDTALSIWSQRFPSQETDFAYDFDHIAAFAKGCGRIARNVVPRMRVPVLDLAYEDFVDDPRRIADALARFLGIPTFDPFGPTSDHAATASVWQVRQPLFARSIGRWRHYAPHLPELTSAFP